ncbi:unnamed protein product, partial [Closterium sp. Yama58-4]
VVRSCPEVCRFCLASYSSLPFRPAALEDHLIPAIERGLQVTNRIGLLGASVTQHPQFDSLLSYLLQPHMKDIRLSIASVRTNTVTPKLAAALAQSGTRSLTIAVESGSERMRRVVNKKLDSADIVAAAVNAQEGGLSGLKLYGMVGLPSETDADVAETVGMMRELRKAAPRLKLTLGCSTFVPKAHTPFQWQPVQAAAEGRLRVLEKEMRKEGVEFRPESYKWSVWQVGGGMNAWEVDCLLVPTLLATEARLRIHTLVDSIETSSTQLLAHVNVVFRLESCKWSVWQAGGGEGESEGEREAEGEWFECTDGDVLCEI